MYEEKNIFESTKEVLTLYSTEKYKDLFSNLIKLETILKFEYSIFLKKHHEKIFMANKFISTKWIVKIIPIQIRKLIVHLLNSKTNKKHPNRKSIVESLGSFYDFYDGEYGGVDLGNNRDSITIFDILKELTFGETLSIILKIKSDAFIKYFKEKYLSWDLNIKTTKITLYNFKLMRNSLFHVRNVDQIYELKRKQN